jgi:hypothetical protein
MITRLLLPAVLLFCPLHADEQKPAPPPAAEEKKADPKKEQPDYVRCVEDEKSTRLETACRTLVLPGGVTVDLIGVIHIADAPYYAALNKRFERYDAVLYELVGNPGDLKPGAPRRKERTGAAGGIHFLQTAMGRYLKLQFQLGSIDYNKANMVHADTTWEEFEAMQKARGESMMGLLLRAMRAQMSGEMDDLRVNELDTVGLLRILMSEDSAAEFKKVLARMFDQVEAITAVMEGEKGSAILSGRNEVVVKKLKEILDGKKKRRLAVFYGAAHMPGIQQTLIKDMEAKPKEDEWLAAWTMPAASKEKPAEEKPADKPAEPAAK